MSGYTEPPVVPTYKGTRIGTYIKLARYDVNFVNNVVSFLQKGQGMTGRQRELAIKLTEKYRKQFKRVGIDVSQIVKEPVFEQAERKVDRTKSMSMSEDFIFLKFPYSQDMIKDINTFLRDDKLYHDGHSQWNATEKLWYINNIESNFVKLYDWCKNNEFKFEDNVQQYYNELKKVTDNPRNHIPYITSDLTLVNAPTSLQEYWDANIKDQTPLDQIRSCGLLGIEIDNEVYSKYNFDIIERQILSNNQVTVDYDTTTVVFACLSLGYSKIAVGLSSHSQSNVAEVEKIVRMYKSKYGTTKGLCISGKSSAFDHINKNINETPDENTKVVITDRMSRLHNTGWDFNSEVTIGQGMFSKRNVFMSNKIIEIKPKVDDPDISTDELF